MGRNDRLDPVGDYFEELDSPEVDEYENYDHSYNDILENPGDYDDDGERGYWADL